MINCDVRSSGKRNKLIRDGVYKLAADPRKKMAMPVEQASVPFLEFSQLENVLSNVSKTTILLKSRIRDAEKLSTDELTKFNTILFQAEQKLLSEKGLPRRPWYRHQIYAPGFYTGYGVKTLPGIREGIEERNWKESQERISVLAEVLMAFDATILQALSLLK